MACFPFIPQELILESKVGPSTDKLPAGILNAYLRSILVNVINSLQTLPSFQAIEMGRPVNSMSNRLARLVNWCSRVGLQWALPGVVVSIVVPLSVSVGDALQFLVSDIVVGVGVWSLSVDSLLSGDEVRWSVNRDGGGGSDKSSDNKLHFFNLLFN